MGYAENAGTKQEYRCHEIQEFIKCSVFYFFSNLIDENSILAFPYGKNYYFR